MKSDHGSDVMGERLLRGIRGGDDCQGGGSKFPLRGGVLRWLHGNLAELRSDLSILGENSSCELKVKGGMPGERGR
jgi:hypothetical protein